MEHLDLSIVTTGEERARSWAAALEAAIAGLADVRVLRNEGGAPQGQLVFVDAAMPALDATLAALDRRGRAVFLVVGESAPPPRALLDGRADDVLVHPFRPLEALGKVKHYQRILMWEEVTKLNASFSELIERLRDDLSLAERLQKGRMPVRFPEVPGFRVTSKYYAGMRSGGDHFDLALSRDGTMVSMVLSDSSSFGLSSAVLGILMTVAMKLTVDESRSCSDTVRRILEEVGQVLSEKDRLSLFYGVVARKEMKLRYLNLGAARGFYARAGDGFRELAAQGPAIAKGPNGPLVELPAEGEVSLDSGGRLVLLSDGFLEAAGGPSGACAVLDGLRAREPQDTVNELGFKVRKNLGDDDLPPQDCTAVVFDVHGSVLKLAKG